MSLSLLYITSLLFLETIEKFSDGCNSCYSSDPENTCYNCLPGYYEIKIPNSSYVKCEKCEANYCDTCLPATPIYAHPVNLIIFSKVKFVQNEIIIAKNV